jgi:serine/threonine protein phosphatase PrpC
VSALRKVFRREVAVTTRSTARSHVGHVRRINEDRVFEWCEGGVWAVADGMGGHRGGDVAAQSVVDALRALQNSGAPMTAKGVPGALADANTRIFARNADLGEQAGATVVVASIEGATLHLAWAGDSRCYRIRGGVAELLTHDHSVVQQLVDAGLLTADAAARHPQSNVITRALGVEQACEVDRRSLPIAAGDRFLLCSDGLSRSLADTDQLTGDLATLADRLVETALARDGSDNISLVLLEPAAVGG